MELSMFQFLIGKVKIKDLTKTIKERLEFQFLIGKVKITLYR